MKLAPAVPGKNLLVRSGIRRVQARERLSRWEASKQMAISGPAHWSKQIRCLVTETEFIEHLRFRAAPSQYTHVDTALHVELRQLPNSGWDQL